MTNTETQEMRHPMVFRKLHSLIMWSILLLVVTGFYIHYPFVDGPGIPDVTGSRRFTSCLPLF